MKTVDTIVKAEHILTMEGEGVGYLADHAVAIDRGRIEAVAPWSEMEGTYRAEQVIDAAHKLLLPGLIDGHMHTSEGILRGLAQDIGNWMMEGVMPFSEQCSEKAGAAGSRLAIAEAVLAGTTTIGDDGMQMDASCAFVEKIGARGNISVRIRDAVNRVYRAGELYEYLPELGEQSLERFRQIYRRYHDRDNGRIKIRLGPQGADFVSLETLQKVKKLAREYGTKIHIHLEQGSREARQMEMRYGMRSIPWLAQMNFLDGDVIGIHLTDAYDDEVRLAASTGASMVLCSASIGIIDGIVPPAKLFQDAGGLVGLGSDQAPGNNCHNIFSEMKLTALFNKIKYGDPEVMPAWKVLRMATIEGARALGIGEVTGSIREGKAADLILVNLKAPTMAPVYTAPMRNFVPNLVYSAHGDEVDTVMVDGRLLVQGGKPVTFDLKEIVAEAQSYADQIGALAEPKFREINGQNARYMAEGKL